jgi:vacuolar-type H+-ATPase subunit I/STV1
MPLWAVCLALATISAVFWQLGIKSFEKRAFS